ncbi:hypothetical protein PVK06_039970 [Gossypium arboreum]|uniref:Uncharacterized protein n=1 Tax=Gossypium arboreum TaxID=29729 RepID=A0ABR0N484_GOSAR|nr:hypothetical protein PVK06_039970 [Gossypium arboreum]
MSSIGASCAEVYLMRKRQKEKMKRMEEESVRRGETSGTTGTIEERKPTVSGRNKVHPGNFTSLPDSAGNEYQGSSNAA